MDPFHSSDTDLFFIDRTPDAFDPFDIRIRIEALISLGFVDDQQSFVLVQTQSLH